MHSRTRLYFIVSILIVICTPNLVFAQTPISVTSVTVEPYRSTNVRSGPSVTFEIIAELQEGQIVEVTGRSDIFSNWLQVNLGSRRGWVAFFTVAVTGELNTLPIVEVGPVIAVSTTTPSMTWQPATSDIFVTAYRRVNVRNGPGTDFEVLGALMQGQTADIIGTSGDANEWLEIDFNGVPGWIAYFVVSVSGDLTQLDSVVLPTLPDDTTTILEDANESVLNQVIVITRFNTNLRETPVLGADVIDIVPYETTVQVLARTEDMRWLRVRHNNVAGWLISSLVNTSVSDINSIPVFQSDFEQASEIDN